MKHTDKCLKEQADLKALHDKYVAQYPGYCQKCGGVGEVTWQENQSPIGSGETWLETLSDLCEGCLGNNKCPRCGGDLGEERDVEDTECLHCGWKFAVKDGGCPPAALEDPCECMFPAEPEELPY